LAVAWGDQIKVGSITGSERLSKYNRFAPHRIADSVAGAPVASESRLSKEPLMIDNRKHNQSSGTDRVGRDSAPHL
jgi:hypothetical protein